MLIAALIAVGFVSAYVAIGLYIRAAPALQTIDIPNQRSSHSIPTPRGGGIVIALIVIVLVSANSYFYVGSLKVGLIASAMLIALVGWLDDLYSIPSPPRLAVHILVAIFVVYSYGSLDGLHIPLSDIDIHFGSFSSIISVFWIVLMINAYNFIDGIDGMAAFQGVISGTGWLMIGLGYNMFEIAGFGGILAAGYLGFLFYNWAPAKVFMGDAGSSFLGFALAVIPIVSVGNVPMSSTDLATSALCLSWLVLFDTCSTRVWRIVRGTRFWEPNRDHHYQKLVISGLKHSFVSGIYAVFGISIALALYTNLRFGGISSYLLPALLVVCPAILVWWTLKKN